MANPGKTKKVNWLKVTGVALLIHIILIALSFVVVAIYSILINPGHAEDFYEAFALQSAPYVSMIGGFICMYFFVTRLNRGKDVNPYIIGVALPAIYIVIDYIMVISMMPDWTSGLDKMLISDALKIAGGLLAAYRRSTQRPATG